MNFQSEIYQKWSGKWFWQHDFCYTPDRNKNKINACKLLLVFFYIDIYTSTFLLYNCFAVFFYAAFITQCLSGIDKVPVLCRHRNHSTQEPIPTTPPPWLIFRFVHFVVSEKTYKFIRGPNNYFTQFTGGWVFTSLFGWRWLARLPQVKAYYQISSECQ